MRRRLILAFAALAIATPSLAAEHGKKEDAEATSTDQDIDIAIVGLPVIIQGRLVNYVFTSVKLILAPGANLSAIRTKEPYFRDALVRAAHRTPFTLGTDPNKIDEVALRRVMLAEARRIAGAKNIVAVKVMNQQPKSRVRTPAG
ncbi:MAG: hypothetical protein B7Y99_11985 [Caulobacterales bacterium 32-69-10]|nr:MAG: hypothetical protein B7Y99_11985 [Caulobacterales bacterium 32-69-10]